MDEARAEEEHGAVPVEVWANDEHRIGLKPLLRRVWAKRGQRPVVPVQHRYEWSYLHGFVRPSDGATFFWQTSWVDVEAWQLVLGEFAAWVGAGTQDDGTFKQVLLVVDNAGWHTGHALKVPEGIELVFLPPRSPELQPCERLWPLTNQAICNTHFDSLDQLERAQARHCCLLQDNPQLVQPYTRFHWWT